MKNDQASDVHLVENPSRIREGAGTAAKNESNLSQIYKRNNNDQRPTSYKTCEQETMSYPNGLVNGSSILHHFTYHMVNMILGIVSIAMIILFLCYVHKPHPNYTQNINKNKVYIMKYELICYILSHAHKIKIYEIYKTCVFTLFNISFLKLSVYLTCCICTAFFYKQIEIYYATFFNVNFDKCFSEAIELSVKRTEKTVQDCRSRHAKFISLCYRNHLEYNS